MSTIESASAVATALSEDAPATDAPAPATEPKVKPEVKQTAEEKANADGLDMANAFRTGKRTSQAPKDESAGIVRGEGGKFAPKGEHKGETKTPEVETNEPAAETPEPKAETPAPKRETPVLDPDKLPEVRDEELEPAEPQGTGKEAQAPADKPTALSSFAKQFGLSDDEAIPAASRLAADVRRTLGLTPAPGAEETKLQAARAKGEAPPAPFADGLEGMSDAEIQSLTDEYGEDHTIVKMAKRQQALETRLAEQQNHAHEAERTRLVETVLDPFFAELSEQGIADYGANDSMTAAQGNVRNELVHMAVLYQQRKAGEGKRIDLGKAIRAVATVVHADQYAKANAAKQAKGQEVRRRHDARDVLPSGTGIQAVADPHTQELAMAGNYLRGRARR